MHLSYADAPQLRKSFRPSATDALIFYALIVVSFVIMRLARAA
jgi:hypothetical protein